VGAPLVLPPGSVAPASLVAAVNAVGATAFLVRAPASLPPVLETLLFQ
jgi:hypothetical protein